MENIVLDRVSKAYDGKVVLRDLSAEFPAGKISCIMAPSGTGKTTLLRILLGLERADSGRIHGLDGVKKSVVFQEDRLCDYLTPISNIRLVAPALNESQVLSAMDAVGLLGCEKQPCRELSGGMRRRVALLRALMAEYDVMFLDEPFKGLDAETKAIVMQDTLNRCKGRTVLLVTHDPSEAKAMSAVQTIMLA